ncbi:MAG: ATP-binding cassette domain-containing protein [Candidatus Latescibacteria bacterium]|nr:ATP-binding cassette domain-containing protein [Candidatus Latescibacterota bacterium]
MIQAINVSKIFESKKILDDISLEVRNEFIGVVGSTGIGKSILLKIIAGLIKPSSGKVMIDQGQTTGFVFQHSALFDSMSVEQNIRLPLEESSSFSKKEIDAKVKEISELLYIPKQMLKQNCNDLSGGERKIVAIARAVIYDPTYLLYDEPTTGLDSVMHNKICQIVKGLNKPGILVTHNKDTVKAVGIKIVYVLDAGKLNLTKELYE